MAAVRYRLSPLAIRETGGSYSAPVSGATVTVYLAGTSTLATCYTNTTTDTPLASSATTTSASGYFEFFVDSEDYANTQRFKVVITKTGYSDVTYDNLLIFPDLSGVRDPWIDLRAFLPSGHVTDGSVDYITEITAAAAEAVSSGKRLFLPAGTWGHGSVFRTAAEIFGVSPLKSILYNQGAGDGLDLGGASYYSLYENFQVKGNASSRDGITLYTTAGDNPAYMQFNNVYSTYNGRHGLYHTRAWATKYSKCKFHYNEGFGIYIFGTTSAENGISFAQCESRWNGGTSAATTYASAKGGVYLSGGVSVIFIGGIYESNNAWQFVIGRDQTYSMSSVIFDGVYTEASTYPDVGGDFYFNYGSKFSIKGTTLGFSSRVGQTSYAYYIDSGMTGTINEDNNYYLAGVAGTSLYINSGARLRRTPVAVVTIMMGDVGAGGVPVTQTLLTASDDGSYKISGNIYCGRDSEAGGVFPFIATRNATARTVTVGSSIVGTATTAPTMAWSGNNLQVTFGANHIGHIEFSYSQTSMPTTFTLNSTYLIRNDELANLPF